MSDQRSVATGVRRRAMIVGCAIAAFCVVAMAGETARRGGSESSELLYIDAGGETQHVLVDGDVAEKYTGDRLSEMLASSPSLAEKKKARAKANLQKKKADLSAGSFPTHEYDDAPILDALADHEQREKKVELTLKAMHTKPAAPKVWQDKKWDRDMIHAMPSARGTLLQSAASWYKKITAEAGIKAPSAAELAALARERQARLQAKQDSVKKASQLDQEEDEEDGDHNVFEGV